MNFSIPKKGMQLSIKLFHPQDSRKQEIALISIRVVLEHREIDAKQKVPRYVSASRGNSLAAGAEPGAKQMP